MHVVNQKCLGCRFGDCIEVCPVKDCFKIGENMVVIDPNLCIDCGLCASACPAKAITHDSKAELSWVVHNAKYSQIWPAVNYPESLKIKLPNAEKNIEIEDKITIFDPAAAIDSSEQNIPKISKTEEI